MINQFTIQDDFFFINQQHTVFVITSPPLWFKFITGQSSTFVKIIFHLVDWSADKVKQREYEKTKKLRDEM